ncbi:MAG: hypothetical protein BJ554DRAFT_1996, partial [Olpidium bornovanus]
IHFSDLNVTLSFSATGAENAEEAAFRLHGAEDSRPVEELQEAQRSGGRRGKHPRPCVRVGGKRRRGLASVRGLWWSRPQATARHFKDPVVFLSRAETKRKPPATMANAEIVGRDGTERRLAFLASHGNAPEILQVAADLSLGEAVRTLPLQRCRR